MPTSNFIKSYWKGHFAEWVSCLFLILRGYRILKRRFKTHVGEIDIIALKKNRLFFIEVKYRSTYIEGLEALTKKQQKRMIRAAHFFLMQNPARFHKIQFDLIIWGPRLWPYYLQNILEE